MKNDKLINNLSIFCADTGSITGKNFGWAAVLADEEAINGNSILELSKKIALEIENGKKVAIGFECPLFIPVRDEPKNVNSAREVDGNRSWSASAGASSLATGLVEILWIMNKLNYLLGEKMIPNAEFDWLNFQKTDSIFLWEAFVTGDAKGSSHIEDAEIAITCFKETILNQKDESWTRYHNTEKTFSLIGAAALRAGWSDSIKILSEKCLVIKPRAII